MAIASYTPGESFDDMVALANRPELNYHGPICQFSQEKDCTSLFVPVQGDFAAAIQEACDLSAK